jgi:hypothetical protein
MSVQVNISPLIPILSGSIPVIACLIGALYNLRRKRTIDDLPTSKTQGVFIGHVELKGSAESETPLVSYLASVRCVHFSWRVEEHWSRTVVESYTDSKGHLQTRTRIESGWTRVGGREVSIPFYLKDDTGIIRVIPEGAKIQNVQIFNESCTPASPLYYGKGPASSIANTTHQRRFFETAIPLHQMLYITGQSRERQDIVAPEIAFDKKCDLFLISTHSEKQISRGYSLWYWIFTVLGFLVSGGSGLVWSLTAGSDPKLSWQPFIFMSGGYFIVLILGLIWATYNSLINLNNRVKQSWSQVDVQLKRRNDLIPNLIAAVERYSNHERDTQIALTELRAQNEATPPGIAGPDYKGLSPLLRILNEKYPDLKANSSFLNLQKNLIDTEQRIALARDYYNETTTFYNTRLEIIPESFVAILAGLHQRTLMGASDFERAPVSVKLED